jgi:hypothetical protein
VPVAGDAERPLLPASSVVAFPALFGGGDGLMVRLLRDEGIDAYASDLYSIPTYAAAFSTEPAPDADEQVERSWRP